MERELDIFLSRDGIDVPIGRLWARVRGGRETASFEYASSWLTDDAPFELVTASFGIGTREADGIVRDVGKVVAKWRTYAKALGITPRQLDRMESAFEHQDLAAARR